MPRAVKNLENMKKHMTDEELACRAAAEEAVIPRREGKLKLRKPSFVSCNPVANRYWNSILRGMEGLILLDDLDSEMLAGYCAMLARRDQTILMVGQLMDTLGVAAALAPEKKRRKEKPLSDAELSDYAFEHSARVAPPPDEGGLNSDQILEAVGKLDTLTGKLQALEKILLSYAEKLGLTPSGRVRLAQQRAERAAVCPDDDLFGD